MPRKLVLLHPFCATAALLRTSPFEGSTTAFLAYLVLRIACLIGNHTFYRSPPITVHVCSARGRRPSFRLTSLLHGKADQVFGEYRQADVIRHNDLAAKIVWGFFLVGAGRVELGEKESGLRITMKGAFCNTVCSGERVQFHIEQVRC